MDLQTLFEKELPPEGEYEVIIEEAKTTVYISSKNQGIDLTVMARPDIDQAAQGVEISDRLVDTKRSHYKFRMLARAIDELTDHKWSGLKEFSKLLIGKPVRVYVKHHEDDYSGETIARICRYMKGAPLINGSDKEQNNNNPEERYV